jgi:hypothetical protein
MPCSYNTGCDRERRVPPLIVCDLRAQLAQLDRYGLPDVGAAVANCVRALMDASRTAAFAVLAHREAH